MKLTRFRKFTLTLIVSLCGLFVLVIPHIAFAHAEHERSEPNADAILIAAPSSVSVWFTQDLFRREGMNGIEVYNEEGIRVDQDDATIDDDNRRLMTVSLAPDLASGVYTVRWYTLSAEDGHEGSGEFGFSVDTVDTSVATTGVTTTAVTTTEEITATATLAVPESATSEPETPEISPAPASSEGEAMPVDSPQANPTSAFPCMGSAMPLILMLGLVWGAQRRTSLAPNRLQLWRIRTDKQSVQPPD